MEINDVESLKVHIRRLEDKVGNFLNIIMLYFYIMDF